ncbi:alpha/beta hydrolase [Pseudoalteromonas obscura]|uniref:Alpha/beta hydrolase n=1 Tax=Pseudoalteromonas obscura TaxID=3048491 RepID=A0ABT7EFX2_9GAMM|nr:alpha/beta hydrolase [Pseudoalteromonas sp. P94(2023)]MDK2593584.1 alpha/beta hydrolase [Pseudoalteromonas sp. P94(2023)]
MKLKNTFISLCTVASLVACNSVSSDSKPLSAGSLSTERAETESTVVFIHGAHLRGSAWQPVATELKNAQIVPHILDLPGRDNKVAPKTITLSHAAEALCKRTNGLPQPQVWVMHSQGGAVAHEALASCNRAEVSHLIYVSAVAPFEGAKPFALLNKDDESNYFKGVTYEDGWMKITNQSEYVASFTNTKSKSLQAKVWTQSVDEPAVTGEGKVHLNKDKLDTIPKVYVFAKEDKIISYTTQQKIAQSIGATKTYSIESGHLPMITQPVALADAIKSALRH